MGTMVDAGKAIRHGDVRMVASLVNQFFGTQPAYSSYAMLILVSHRRVQGWDSDAIAEDHRMCYFAGLWNSLDVAMEGEATGRRSPWCSSRATRKRTFLTNSSE